MRRGDVRQHPFGRKLRAAIRGDRALVRCLRNEVGAALAINGGGGGEDQALHTAGDGSFEQGARAHRVVHVVIERLGNGIDDDNPRCEVDDFTDVVRFDHGLDKRDVAHITDDECRGGRDGMTVARRKVIQHDHAFAPIDESMRHVAADIARTTRYQDRHRADPQPFDPVTSIPCRDATRTCCIASAIVWVVPSRRRPMLHHHHNAR